MNIKELSIGNERAYLITTTKENNEKSINKTVIPFTLRGNLKIINKGKDNPWIIAGYANVTVVDSDDQFIPVETLKKGIETLLNDPHYSNLMLIHQNVQIGKIISEFGDLTTHVDDKGLFIVAEIRKDIKTADEVWAMILEKEINSFSIGCEVIEYHEQCDDNKCITVLDEINIFEVSVCTNPVNKESGFVVVSKSKDKDVVCSECALIEDKMSETKDKEELIEETKAEVEPEKTEEKSEEKTEETIETKEEVPIEEEAPEQELSAAEKLQLVLESIEQRLNALEEALQASAKPDEEEEEEPPEEDEPPMKSEELPEEKTEEKKEDEPPKEEEPPEEEKPKKSEIEDLIIGAIKSAFQELKSQQDLELAVKAKEDRIESLEEKVKLLTKSQEPVEPKTVTDDSPEELVLEEDDPIKISDKGFVTSRNFM